jgi:hypothetical protein
LLPVYLLTPLVDTHFPTIPVLDKRGEEHPLHIELLEAQAGR